MFADIPVEHAVWIIPIMGCLAVLFGATIIGAVVKLAKGGSEES